MVFPHRARSSGVSFLYPPADLPIQCGRRTGLKERYEGKKKDDSNLYKKGMRNEETRVGNTLHSPPVRPEGRIVFLLSSSISNGPQGFPRGRKQAKSFVGKCVRRTGCCAKGRLMWTESSCNRAKLSSGYRAVCELNLPLSIIS